MASLTPNRLIAINLHPSLLLIQMHKAGRKTGFCQLMKNQPVMADDGLWSYTDKKQGHFWFKMTLGLLQQNLKTVCPFGQAGDALYINEACAVVRNETGESTLVYKVDNPDDQDIDWRNPAHMKKIHARLWVEIVNVRAQPVQQLTAEECIAQGIEPKQIDAFKGYRDYSYPDKIQLSPQASFASLWKSEHGEESYQKNEWVWSIEYRQIAKPE
ncbi:hypothetical protein [Fibrella forsythiae]|uniref:Uncharacterized protein n=1 Tax=Fibrella forsythiae TaxID=2817061 RepID=A0ABS3JMD6_9BACT|nr:hypothetical protein [Fibrella forsythiae]MBO0951171.1 hypothetical protein [Fibrella forsythiae]